MTMESLAEEVKNKATLYLQESGEAIDSFPTSIVDFVIEYSIENSHFPNYYTDDDIAAVLSRCKSVMAMECQDIYSKIGAEGQTAHGENGYSRTYESAWISDRLIRALPNFVNTPSTIRAQK